MIDDGERLKKRGTNNMCNYYGSASLSGSEERQYPVLRAIK